jgi:hypothetical protein
MKNVGDISRRGEKIGARCCLIEKEIHAVDPRED